MYAVIGWLVVKGVKSYAKLKYGDKPKYAAAGVILAGGIAGAWIAQRKSGSAPSE